MPNQKTAQGQDFVCVVMNLRDSEMVGIFLANWATVSILVFWSMAVIYISSNTHTHTHKTSEQSQTHYKI
jgi:hypothetical protein